MSDDQKTAQQAQEQADEHVSFLRSKDITTEDGAVFKVRNPMFFDAPRLLAYNKLHHLINRCDKWPDKQRPEQRMKSVQPDGTVVETHIGAHTVEGDWIEPYQEGGVLVDPPYEVQVAQIVLGDKYDEFEAAGGSPRELVEMLAELRRGVTKRVDADPKSDGGGRVLASVPTPDSQ